MNSRGIWRSVRAGIVALGVGIGAVTQFALPALADGGKAFSTLEPGFSQSLYGMMPSFAGGIAFAKDGDVWANVCGSGSGSTMFRFDKATLLPAQSGTATLHAVQRFDNVSVGCGMVNGKNRNIYTNTSTGVVELDPETAATIKGPFVFDGSGGNVLGISADPKTGDLVYVGTSGTLIRVNAALTTHSVFSTALSGKFLDGVFFDPTGDFLFVANRTDREVAVVSSDGTLVQSVPIGREPDGIAFHAGGDKFVVTNNTDGTMTKIAFPGGDATKAPAVSQFATGGFRGDMSQVGPDGALYLTQDGSRMDDGTTQNVDSIVRICCDFVAQPGSGVTTTTTAPPTTTTVPETTIAEQGSTLPPTTAAETLPFTGSSSGPLAMVGIGLVMVGWVLGVSMRRARLR